MKKKLIRKIPEILDIMSVEAFRICQLCNNVTGTPAIGQCRAVSNSDILLF
jgi:hypothetical protein